MDSEQKLIYPDRRAELATERERIPADMAQIELQLAEDSASPPLPPGTTSPTSNSSVSIQDAQWVVIGAKNTVVWNFTTGQQASNAASQPPDTGTKEVRTQLNSLHQQLDTARRLANILAEQLTVFPVGAQPPHILL